VGFKYVVKTCGGDTVSSSIDDTASTAEVIYTPQLQGRDKKSNRQTLGMLVESSLEFLKNSQTSPGACTGCKRTRCDNKTIEYPDKEGKGPESIMLDIQNESTRLDVESVCFDPVLIGRTFYCADAVLIKNSTPHIKAIIRTGEMEFTTFDDEKKPRLTKLNNSGISTMARGIFLRRVMNDG
jgi:hypothetical protein